MLVVPISRRRKTASEDARSRNDHPVDLHNDSDGENTKKPTWVSYSLTCSSLEPSSFVYDGIPSFRTPISSRSLVRRRNGYNLNFTGDLSYADILISGHQRLVPPIHVKDSPSGLSWCARLSKQQRRSKRSASHRSKTWVNERDDSFAY